MVSRDLGLCSPCGSRQRREVREAQLLQGAVAPVPHRDTDFTEVHEQFSGSAFLLQIFCTKFTEMVAALDVSGKVHRNSIYVEMVLARQPKEMKCSNTLPQLKMVKFLI